MKKHKRARLLAKYMSVWLYSTGRPPEPINKIYLLWLETGHIPSKRSIKTAIRLGDYRLNLSRKWRQKETRQKVTG